MDEHMKAEARELVLASPALSPASMLVVVTRVLIPIPAAHPGPTLIGRNGRSLRQAQAFRINVRVLALVLVGGVTAFAAGRWQGQPDERSYAFRFALPPIAAPSPGTSPIEEPAPVSRLAIKPPALVKSATTSKTSSAYVLDALEVPAPRRIADEGSAAGLAPTGQLLRISGLRQVQAAAMESLRTGIAVPWSAAGIEGFAVAGPAQVTGNYVCRYAAIWAEIGAQGGKSLPQRYCLNEQGKWNEVGVRHSGESFAVESGGRNGRSQSSTWSGEHPVQDPVDSDGAAEQPK